MGQLSFDDITRAFSHELLEAVTDPDVKDGWLITGRVDSAGKKLRDEEVADECNVPGSTFHGFNVSRFFSVKQNACSSVTDDNSRLDRSKAKISLISGGTCVGGAAPGAHLRFEATGTRKGLSDTLSQFRWTASPGVQVVGGTTSSTLVIVAPANPSLITISVTVQNTAGAAYEASFAIEVLSPDDLERASEACRLKRLVQSLLNVNFHVDPLWDPLRDFNTSPIRGDEIRLAARLGTALTQFATAASRLSYIRRSQEENSKWTPATGLVTIAPISQRIKGP